MSIIDRAAFIVAESAHQQHQSTAARVDAKLEKYKEDRSVLANAQSELDERRLENEQMQRGRKKDSDGDWVQIDPLERAAGLIPSNSSLSFDLERLAADEKKLRGELEVGRREAQSTMGQLSHAQERDHRAKSEAEGHARDANQASRPGRAAATGAASEGRAAEVQLTARETASSQKARATSRIEDSAAKIKEKVEETHHHEHESIDDRSAGSFFGKLFGVIGAIVGAIAGACLIGLGSALSVLQVVGAGLLGGKGASTAAESPWVLSAAGETATAETAMLEKTKEEFATRQAESMTKRAEQTEAETERFVAELRRAKAERRA